MGSLGLLVLMGVGLLSFALISDDSDTDSPVADPPQEPSTPPEVNLLELDGSETITGTLGNDSLDIYTGDPNLGDLERVNLSDGDDVATTDLLGRFTIDGGAGDDSITSIEGLGNVLIGGEGNDTLTSGPTADVYGDAGDDVLNINATQFYIDDSNVDGGMGDDTLNISTGLPVSNEDVATTFVRGGEGADTLNIELLVNGGRLFEDTNMPPLPLEISDFDPNEDALAITILREQGFEDRALLETSLLRSEEGEATLTLLFSPTDTDPVGRFEISLGNNPDITIDDVILLDA